MLIQANALALPIQSGIVQCCVTSPPYYGLRDYGIDGQLGLEATPDLYVARMVQVFREVWRVMRDDGTLWLNLGDSYARNGGWSDNHGLSDLPRGECGRAKIYNNRVPIGLKEKDLVGIPWRVAFALQADGWYLRSDIIWAKPNPMPESATDRPTKAHEYLFLMTKNQRYYYNAAAIREPISQTTIDRFGSSDVEREGPNGQDTIERSLPTGSTRTLGASSLGRNRRSVWTVNTQPYPEAHFATFPEKLVEPCILAGTKPGDLVMDPFAGSGTVGRVAQKHCRRAVGVDLNPAYLTMAVRRQANVQQRLVDL